MQYILTAIGVYMVLKYIFVDYLDNTLGEFIKGLSIFTILAIAALIYYTTL